MFEFAWPWVFALAPLPWLLRLVLPAADSGEAALKVSFLDELESLAGRRARVRLPAWRQQMRFALLWFLLLLAAARPQWVGAPCRYPPAAATCCSRWMSPVPWTTATCAGRTTRSAAWN